MRHRATPVAPEHVPTFRTYVLSVRTHAAYCLLPHTHGDVTSPMRSMPVTSFSTLLFTPLNVYLSLIKAHRCYEIHLEIHGNGLCYEITEECSAMEIRKENERAGNSWHCVTPGGALWLALGGLELLIGGASPASTWSVPINGRDIKSS